MPKYSIIIPIYNRKEEVLELIESLGDSSYKKIELLLIDGSPDNVLKDIDQTVINGSFQFHYQRIHKPYLGISDSRNLGAKIAKGEFLIFFDSDVIIPPEYFDVLDETLGSINYDMFGGPDCAHESFNPVQKAISYCMTSVLTTGGIRGKKVRVGKFKPRGFNMGVKKKIFDEVDGFNSNLKVGEDIDLSIRVINRGYKSGLIPELFVYHKRRVNLKKFYNQVFRFGAARILLGKNHKGENRIAFYFPLFFLIALLAGPFLLFNVRLFQLWSFGLTAYLLMNLIIGTIQNKSLRVGLLIVPTLLVQFTAYAFGFIKNWYFVYVLKKSEGIFTIKKEGPDSPE
ncbi:glycosyltransferase [Ekhidna sp.]|uniref:glycosyltransferase n=1 Tax=Ekhidna sp. TaxID=2608089 RepID=UPI003296F2BC